MATSLNVSYPTDALGEVGRSCAVQTAVRQNTETKPYTLRDPQPVKIAEQWHDVFGSPRREDESGSGVEDGLKSIQEVTGDTDQYCAAVINFADD